MPYIVSASRAIELPAELCNVQIPIKAMVTITQVWCYYVNTRGIDIAKNLKWMSVSQRRDYVMSILMFKSIHGLAPDCMCDEINMQSDIAERSTRSQFAVVPYVSLESFLNYFAYCGMHCHYPQRNVKHWLVLKNVLKLKSLVDTF